MKKIRTTIFIFSIFNFISTVVFIAFTGIMSLSSLFLLLFFQQKTVQFMLNFINLEFKYLAIPFFYLLFGFFFHQLRNKRKIISIMILVTSFLFILYDAIYVFNSWKENIDTDLTVYSAITSAKLFVFFMLILLLYILPQLYIFFRILKSDKKSKL